MDSQAVAGKPLGQYRHDPAGIHFQCAADNKIISETDQEASAFQAWLSLVLEPYIEDLMEKDIGQHGGKGTTLHDAGVGMAREVLAAVAVEGAPNRGAMKPQMM